MSRIGKKSIAVPAGVTVKISENGTIYVKGPKGELERVVDSAIQARFDNGVITLSPVRNARGVAALWGLWRSIIANMVLGATSGFEKKLEIEGIGYRVALDGPHLVFQLGFSHPVRFEAPEGIRFLVEKNVITVAGSDKEVVGNTAARIRDLRPPEPYKGKGIKYQGEVIRRKAGKKTVG